MKPLNGVKQYIIRENKCVSLELSTDKDGYFKGYNFSEEKYNQCLAKPHLFCFEYEDYVKIEQFLVTLWETYYDKTD